ncbi:leucine-rich repeat domain-containing protein [Phototrophicus methaneseepsis]|uniref:Leucine-rich repeat domain-containing protein n=1 Tax=Phototrophicus methaneseepsis TaxID=2710758 RepID=A0A7S8E9J9_9CHLR|nr:leucine-rich repeat domain-containing protein [Phototrophicus methaneseepsis]QPC82744.1 leucine-rich repeat domain-containing protein [Phototrophicus methaneseepsis]
MKHLLRFTSLLILSLSGVVSAQSNAEHPIQAAMEYAARHPTSNVAVSLWNDGLTELPPEFAQAKSIFHLDLNQNHFEQFPLVVTQLPKLTKLTLASNNLTSLPPEISDLNAITELDLSNNQLTELPPEIGQLKSLQWLNLDHNNLTSLPPEIGQLDNLTYLHVGHNQLTTLPPEIANMDNLQILWVADNQFSTLPPIEISAAPKLTFLNLERNPLEDALPQGVSIWGDSSILAYLQAQYKLAQQGRLSLLIALGSSSTLLLLGLIWRRWRRPRRKKKRA